MHIKQRLPKIVFRHHDDPPRFYGRIYGTRMYYNVQCTVVWSSDGESKIKNNTAEPRLTVFVLPKHCMYQNQTGEDE